MTGDVASTPDGPEDAAPPVLEIAIEGLSIGGEDILGAIQLDLRPGDTLALTGPSGIGKTSLLRAVAGLEPGYRGAITAPKATAIVFQEPMLLPWRSLTRNLTIPTGISDMRAEALLEEVGLAGRGAQYPGQLSLGQQRRIALARAFATEPQLLLMDEPFVSLDPETAQDMMALFAALRARHKVTTLLVTHSAAEAEALASRIVTLSGSPAQIASEVQNKGAYFQLSASGVTSSRS